MPKITDTEINIKLPGGTRGIKGHPGPVGPIGPQGEPGVQGNKGIVGPKGEVGEIPAFSIGSMTIGTPASITTTGTPENNILNMVIPKGQKGDAPDSPEISFSKSGKKTTMTVDIGETTKTYEMNDGVDPSVSVSKNGNDTTITTNMYGVSKSTVVPDGEHQFTAGEGISIENREVSDTNYDYIYGDATQEHSGTSFVIEKGLEAPIDSIELKGDTYQYTTTQSKNLLNNTFRQGSESSTSVANYIFSNNASLLQSGTYTFSNNLDNSFQYAIFGTVNNFPNSDTKVYNSGWKTGNTTFTISQTLYVGILIRKTNLSNLTPSTVSSNQFQIETGSSATSYVPFVQNSPSPDYQQNIEVVAGEQDIQVCGKNLLNLQTWVKGRIDPATGLIQREDKITTLTKTDSSLYFISNATWSGIASDFIPITTGNYIYKMACTTTCTLVWTYVDLYDKWKNYLGRLSSVSWTNNQTKTMSVNITNTSVAYIRIHFENKEAGTTTITNPQLEKGSTTTDFEAYKGNTYEINLGKNLFDIDSVTGGYNITKNGDTFTSNALSSYGGFNIVFGSTINVKNGEDYCISYDIKVNSGDIKNLNYYGRLSNGTNYTSFGSLVGTFNISDQYQRVVWKTSATADFVADRFVSQVAGSITNAQVLEVKNIQIEKGSVATSYSPYKTPIELCKIGNYQDYIKRSSGRNLLDANASEIGFYYNGNGGISTSENWHIQQVLVKPNTSYYLSGNNRDNTNAQIVLLDSNKNLVSVFGNYRDTHLINTTETTSYIGVSIADYNGTADMKTIMLNEGSTALPYEPYGTGWYVCKNIGKVVLNGSESWSTNTGYSGYYRFATNTAITNRANNYLGYNNMFTQRTTQAHGAYEYLYFDSASQYIYIQILPSRLSGNTANDFKNWLSTNNTTVYYVLNTPTYIGIEDEELINQLESIWTIDGINNINIATSYLPAYAKITSYNKNANGMLSSIIKMTEILEERSND